MASVLKGIEDCLNYAQYRRISFFLFFVKGRAMKLVHVWRWTCITISCNHAEKESASEKAWKAISRWCANRALPLLTLFGGGLRLRKYGDTNNRSQASLQGPKWMSSVTQDSSCALCKKLFSHCPLLSLSIVNTSDFPGLDWRTFQFQEVVIGGRGNDHMFNVIHIFSFNFSLHTINWIIKFHSEVFLQLHSICRLYAG